MNKIFEKHPIVRYIISAYIKTFLCACVFGGLIYGGLSISGIYVKVESVLDLKYNSPFVLIPLYGSAVLSVLSFVIGALQYFHKYKRAKSNGTNYILKRMEKLK